ncbi:MAG: hypothetical protein R3301_14260, partial [Saprospiraceae bacterium]|nr:hypothetical protein [Saprospiraceae bacterium]
AVTTSGAVYIGTDIGVFYRSPSMTDWMPWKNGLPNTPVTGIVLQEDIDRIYCSTFGRGVWKNNLIDGNCPTNLAISGSWSEYYYYQASDLITMTATIEGTLNSHMHVRSGGAVVLQPGFKALRHGQFSAAIGPCGSGGIPVNGDQEDEIEIK